MNLPAISDDNINSTRFRSLDLRASKSIGLPNGQKIELLAQVFNVFNTANLGGVQTNARATTFGQASRAGAGTQAELAARFIW